MNRLKMIFAALALALPLALFSCMPPIEPDVGEIPETTERENPSTPAAPTFLYQAMTYEYKTDVSASIDFFTTEMSEDYLILANKTYPLGTDYDPSNLVTLTCPISGDKSIYLESRAAQALYAMLGEMQADGVTDIMVTSGYRSYAYQQQLYQSYLKIEKSRITPEAYAYFGEDYIQSNYTSKGLTQLTHEDAVKVVLSYSAVPGTSEHQTGLCVDFVTSDAGLTTAFENTEAFDWLSQNAYRFGFILRYPESKTAVTGYSYEPWHFRFVGREAATEIALRSLTLEEFLGAS
jgi:D-alanyl-D-alanine carboxypeptidase